MILMPIRALLLAPAIASLPIFMLLWWLMGEPYWRHCPRWTWQLVRYGPKRAREML